MAGTVTFQEVKANGFTIITANCVGDAADGSFPATKIPGVVGKLVALRTNPGATAPQDNWDVVLNDEDGIDRLQGVGANRHTTTSQEVSVVYSGTAIHPVCVNEPLSLAVSGNNVASANIAIRLVFTPR